MNIRHSHCKRGHPLKDPNLYHYRSGWTCKACIKRRARKKKLAKIAETDFCKHGHWHRNQQCEVCRWIAEELLFTRKMNHNLRAQGITDVTIPTLTELYETYLDRR